MVLKKSAVPRSPEQFDVIHLSLSAKNFVHSTPNRDHPTHLNGTLGRLLVGIAARTGRAQLSVHCLDVAGCGEVLFPLVFHVLRVKRGRLAD